MRSCRCVIFLQKQRWSKVARRYYANIRITKPRDYPFMVEVYRLVKQQFLNESLDLAEQGAHEFHEPSQIALALRGRTI